MGKDPNLKSAIELKLRKRPRDSITNEDMARLHSLIIRDQEIKDLTGLEHAINIRNLDLMSNSISDITPLAKLIHMEFLYLGKNLIKDMSPVENMTKLEVLWLFRNNITDISPVASLTNLKDLSVNGTVHLDSTGRGPRITGEAITDISPIANLIKLERLDLGSNKIKDISVIANLTQLKELNLAVNEISNISSLSNLTQITELQLAYNLVYNISSLAGLTKLTFLWLSDNNVSDISAVARLTNLTSLSLGDNNISDISAVANLTNLMELSLFGNNVSDISAVARLTNLTSLSLGDKISDISAVAGLTNLKSLSLGDNNISNISAVAGLINLESLWLFGNNISDISAVAGLINLESLLLRNNGISDISAVAGLANLTTLWLSSNSISDLSAMVNLTNLTFVNVESNPLSYPAIYTQIPILQNRGVRMNFYNRTPTKLVKISGDQHVLPSASLSIIVEVQNEINSVFEGVPVMFSITEGDETLSTTNTVTDKNGRAESILTIGPNIGTTTIEVSAAEIEHPVTFTVVAKEDVIIPDSNLRNAIRVAIKRTLGKVLGDQIDPSDIARLTILNAQDKGINDLTGLELATNLTDLYLTDNNITDISALANLTNLTTLLLDENNITDISMLRSLTNITGLMLNDNNISDMSVLANLTNLTTLWLSNNNITDISAVAGLTNLTGLVLDRNNISDISVLAGLTNLEALWLSNNNITDISMVAGLANLTGLRMSHNNIIDISAVAGLTNLTNLSFFDNNIMDVSAIKGLTNLTSLRLGDNKISDISALAGLINLTELWLYDNSITDISPLVANTGLGDGDYAYLAGNALTYSSIYTHIPTLTDRGVTVQFTDRRPLTFSKISGEHQRDVSFAPLSRPFVVEVRAMGYPFEGVPVTFTVTAGGGTLSVTQTTTDKNGRAESTLTLGPNLGTHTVEVSAAGIQEPVTFNAISDELPTEYLWSVPSGINLIHVPLKVTAVDGVEMIIESVSDLYDALGGTDAVNVLVTYDYSGRGWVSYASPQDRDTSADRLLTDDMGIIAIMTNPVTARLQGTPLGTNENSTITLKQGTNLVGIPLRDSRITRISDLFTIDGIRDNVIAIIVSDGGEFKAVGRAGDDGDIPIIGGQSFLLNVRSDATVAISGVGWYNALGVQAAPLITVKGIEVGNATPVLAMRGSIANERIRTNKANFRVIAKNLSTGKAVSTTIANADLLRSKGIGYQVTIVDTETARAAQIGDILEISAQSTDPFIGIQPFQYTVTTEDVKRSRIELNDLIAYEIPPETKLLANYPNPFNPETWIPYRLAEDANVLLTIYDSDGRVVRSLDVGHRKAAVYETRDKAIYWDGRNQVGERVASGVYFYHLSVGDYSATKRMVILK